ncbi:hypothetical protein LOTGIDRAFT_236817 [Lottia gigantea]|uniref:UBZ4-type domain-containing protein n=1 Tax=Lottia gigantea TaxID=225164 RepID=V4B3R4_LOTGI|nr:hypothetical protein LOTGIDRAFT_236817 [Lottia gigantea]ESO83024.1 hypothetical protein LOTGIDRAFT_236817 [Lottia gigantea]
MESEEDSTQPPEQDITPQHFPIEILETEGFSQQSSGDEKSGMKFDVLFDPNCSQCKPLTRHFISKTNKNTLPYYTPEGMNCCSYTAIIIKMFKTYTQQLIKAQRQSKTTTSWGKPVMPGRHHSKTIDLKKRGCLSVNMDSSADENEKISPRKLSPDVFDLNNVSKFDVEKRTLIPSPVKESYQLNFVDKSKDEGDSKLYNYDIETQIYNEIQSSENEAADDSDFVPEKESSKQRRAKPKSKPTRKRKKSISPIEFTSKKTPQKIVSDFFMQIHDSQSKFIQSTSSQWLSKDSELDQSASKDSKSNFKDSKSSQSNFKDLKSSQSNYSSKDDLILASQDSNEILNPQGDIYSTQVSQQKRTPRLGRPARKKAKVETLPKRRISISSDDELLEKHLKDVSVKKIKLNPISLDKDNIFNEGDSKIRSKTTRTYQKKARNKKPVEPDPENAVDFDQLLSLPTLHYSPQSSQKTTSPKNSQSDRENVLSRNVRQIQGESSDISSESPIKTVIKRKSFSLWDSEDELDSNLIERASCNQSKTVVNVKPMQQTVTKDNGPSTSQVTSPGHQSNVNVVTPIRRLALEVQPEDISNQEEDEVEEVIECPLCGNNFSSNMIERHAATCGEEEIQEEDIPVPARPFLNTERNPRDEVDVNLNPTSLSPHGFGKISDSQSLYKASNDWPGKKTEIQEAMQKDFHHSPSAAQFLQIEQNNANAKQEVSNYHRRG